MTEGFRGECELGDRKLLDHIEIRDETDSHRVTYTDLFLTIK